jgi:YbbR domain-containing protein
MKKIYDSKLFWVIVSCVLSFVLWVYVTSVQSDEVRQTFRGVRVEMIGENVLRDSRGLVITDLSTSTVSVELIGPRRVIAAMSPEDIRAQIDVSKLTQSSYASMQYTIAYPNRTDTTSISVSRKVPDTVNFTVSKLNSKSIPVRGSFNGSIADGFTAEMVTFEPSEITVSGPDAYLRDISYAWVSFGSETISSTYSIETGYTLMNSADEEADVSGISCSSDVVKATVPILEMKSLPLTVNLIYGAGANENNTKVSIDPQEITLAGDSAILNAMNNVPIATIDLTSFNSTYTDTYNINFDNSLTNVEGLTEAEVKVEVVGLETKTFTVTNIQCRGVSDGYEADVLSRALTVRLRGTAAQLAAVSESDLVAVADLTNTELATGSNIVSVRIQVDGSFDVGAVGGPYTITVDIRRAG